VNAGRSADSLPLHHEADVSSWGMILFLATEGVFFVSLIAGYHFLRMQAPAWPPEGTAGPDLILPLVNTALLIGSSAAYIQAERGLRQGRSSRLRGGLLIAVLLGVIFLGLQAVEYTRSTLIPSADAYSGLFYAITGIHAVHVLVGVIMLFATLIWAEGGRFSRSRHAVVTNVGYYWHFVDAVWVLLVLPSVYFSPYL
jgi:heme/copper-type cytochrome/quinol oxidase subunit 3